MRSQESHVSDQDLLRAADGELAARDAADIQTHLVSCWTCRARMGQLDAAIAAFVQAHHRSVDPLLPPAAGARSLLKLEMARLGAESPPNLWGRLFSTLLYHRRLTLACCIFIVLGMVALAGHFRRQAAASRPMFAGLEARAIPDPRLTPGATLPVTRDDVCADGIAETVRLVPVPVALQVFAAYGITEPRPHAYELDYLITPALGGSDSVRNFWPQPYGAVWNAHLKDALEDHMYRQVCAGNLNLATAQRDIARDWIAAYKKYFGTNEPLAEHASFLRDRPWE